MPHQSTKTAAQSGKCLPIVTGWGLQSLETIARNQTQENSCLPFKTTLSSNGGWEAGASGVCGYEFTTSSSNKGVMNHG